MTDQPNPIATRLRVAREQAGLSQGQVAKMLGMHRPTISEMEAGRRKVSAEELANLARIYRVSLDWLAQGDTASEARTPLEIAARKFSSVKQEDLDRLIELLMAIRAGKEQDE